ncbi:NDP-sugar synthase [Candidatus Gracilibacteria bacterium]|nr:NDP-sugar synthase [Candidatus Gracilibacteria bacterium]MCF7819465.1 NDP-sugar synthase [Candidatus Gracilibacteria bacterium]
MNVLILAGGFATRLWPLTEKRAKPLLLLDGKTILAHILEKIPSQAEVFLLTNKKFQSDFIRECKKLNRENVHIFCEDAHSDGEKLGALRAVSVAIKEFHLTENAFIFAGDNLLPKLSIEQIFCSKNESKIAIREVESKEEARKFGVVEIAPSHSSLQEENFEVIGFEEKPEKPKSTLVSTGFACIGSELFSVLHQFADQSPDALGGIFSEFLRQGKTVLAEKIEGEWFDVGSFETYLGAHKKLQKKDLAIAENVQQKNNFFSGKVFLGEGSNVQNCRITDSVIYPGCQLQNCHISHSVLDEKCDLEGLDLNRKLVRKGTVLKAKSE